MLDQMLESGSTRPSGARALVGFSVSFGAHALAFGAFMAGAFLAVGTIHRPPARLSDPERMIFITRPPAAAAAAAPLGGRAPRERRREEPPRRTAEEEEEMVQPEAVPEEIPEDPPREETLDDELFEEGIPEGHRLGIPGGIPDGQAGGVVNGDPNGVVGGVESGVGGGGPPLDPNGEIVALTGEIREPERIHYVQPDYPEAARMARLEGTVNLTLILGRDGSVEEVKVISGNRLFRQAAVEAALQWRYRPALQSGRPVRISMLVVVEFRLR